MEGEVALLDTPKKVSLQSQSTSIRAALKDFERTFAAEHDGQKPGKDDIKADAVISRKYKEYNKIRDVLAGKLSVAALEASSPLKRKRADHEASPSRSRLHATPRRKRTRPDEAEEYDAPSSATPRRILSAIGPTPQRDGQVLGIFDLLSNHGSGRSMHATPTSRKRKIEIAFLGEDEDTENQPVVAQTPSQRSAKKSGDLLDHLAGTPVSQIKTSRHKHSRTPVSNGKKFMLSQFFATPSSLRFAAVSGAQVDPTPLRSRVLGLSPTQPLQKEPAKDATPAYLRRSHSFKDRLLSASSNPSRDASSDVDASSPSSVRTGPRRVSGRQSKFMPKPLSQIAAEMRKREDAMHDDDLDAMREIEDEEAGVLVKDSQAIDHSNKPENVEVAPQRVYKKKGQKRTTRRVIMRPSKVKTRDRPDSEPPSGNEPELPGKKSSRATKQTNEDEDEDEDEFDDAIDTSEDEITRPARPSKSKAKTKKAARPDGKDKALTKPLKPAKEVKERTINPNAVSHMNFRSLKIKNKNSKAKGRGRGRFGRR